MVEHHIKLDLVFNALSDPTRRSMLLALRSGERSVAELAEPFSMSLAGAAKHVQVLEKSKLITRRKLGRSNFCSINKEAFDAAEAWFEKYAKFWNSRLDALSNILEKEQEQSNERRQSKTHRKR